MIGLGVLTVLVGSLVAADALAFEYSLEPSPFGAFAFADSFGTRVLALSRMAEPESVRICLAAEGRQFPVRYLGFQKYSAGGSDRDAALDFEHCEGPLFCLEGGRIRPDDTCFLASDSLLAMAQPLPMHREHKTLAVDPRDPFMIFKGRELRNAWSLAMFSVWGHVSLYEFRPLGRSYLASIVLWDADDGHLHFMGHDYPAELRAGDPYSLWRVDDDGEFCSECFEVLFVLRGWSGYWMGVSWGGAEGESLQLLRSVRTDSLTRAVSGYRYLAPR